MTGPKAGHSISDASSAWTAVSVAIVVPFLSEWRQPADAPIEEWTPKPWRLQGLLDGRGGGPGSARYKGVPDEWFPYGRARTAIEPEKYSHLTAGKSPIVVLTEAWRFQVAALEQFEFPVVARGRRDGGVRGSAFLVIHGVLTSTRPDGPVKFVREIRKPCRAQESLVSHAFQRAGIRAGQGNNGWIGKRGSEFRPIRGLVPFVVTHASTGSRLPEETPLGAGYESWSAEQRWSWCLTSGHPSLRDTLGPGRGSADAEFATSCLGPTFVRAGREGIAFISQSLDEGHAADPSRHSTLTQLAHLHVVRLVMLNLRQRFFLEDHADDLAALDWDSPGGLPDGKALDLEKRRIRFENKYWFTRLPERPAVAPVMQVLNEASQMADLLQDIANESSAISRVLDLENAQRSREAARRSQDAALQSQQAAEMSQQANDRLNFLIGVFALPAVILGATALVSDPSPGLAAAGLGLSVLVAAVMAFVLSRGGWLTRKTHGTHLEIGAGPDAPNGARAVDDGGTDGAETPVVLSHPRQHSTTP